MGVDLGGRRIIKKLEGSCVCADADADAAESDTSSIEAEAWSPTIPLGCGAAT